MLNDFSNYLGYAWLITGILLLSLEVSTPGLFYFISFAIGSCCAALAAFLDYAFEIQCAVAIVTALLSLWIMRSCIKTTSSKVLLKTNSDALVGQQAVVINVIEPHKKGRVKVNGEEWPAIAQGGVILQKGTLVTIVAIEGNKLLVT
jgi:membrane protein implicated in regulation of membrane protease activity